MDSGTLRVHRPPQRRTKAIDQSPLCGQERFTLERHVLAKVKKTPRFLMHELFDFFQGRADCFPSNAKISEVSGISPRNIQLVLRQLEAAELVKSVEDRSVPSQRRLVLLDHPNALQVLKALHALPSWLERFACTDERSRGARVAPSNRPGGAMAALQGAQNPQPGGATVAPESGISKPPTEKRAYKCFARMNPGEGGK
jgi:Helix-turn-helix domain